MIHTAEEFARLRRSDVPAEYQRAASEEAPVDVWLSVIDQFPDLREWVAHNKTVPLPVLELLARDPSASVRFTVASKRKLSHELQILLVTDPDSSVRHGLARNAKCEPEVLQRLAEDSESFVREVASKRLSVRGDSL